MIILWTFASVSYSLILDSLIKMLSCRYLTQLTHFIQSLFLFLYFIQETDLMDDLDTPFHNDDGETSFVSHKQSVLSHQDHGFSPDHFPNWSFDYVDELSRRSSFLESQCNQTVEQVNVSAYSYLEANRAGVSTDCEMTLESVVAAKSNLTSKENNSEQSDCHIPSQLFEYHGAKSDSSRTMDEDAKSNKNYHSLRHVPDFQALYTDQVGSHVCTNRANLQQLDDQVPSHHIQQSIHQAPIYQDENSNGKYIHVSHVIRKHTYAICEQRRRSACAFAQSDQRLRFRWKDSTIPLLAIAEI